MIRPDTASIWTGFVLVLLSVILARTEESILTFVLAIGIAIVGALAFAAGSIESMERDRDK